MSSIRSILEKINPCMCSFKDGFAYDRTKPCHCSAGKLNDQALKEISELIDKAKPEEFDTTLNYNHSDEKFGYNNGIDQYQSNLKELLK